MPTVMRIRGDRVVIYPNDHRPAHVHVIGAAFEAIFHLHCPGGPPELVSNTGFSRSYLRRLKSDIEDGLEPLCETWSAIHGDP
jgi:hypothetical protein